MQCSTAQTRSVRALALFALSCVASCKLVQATVELTADTPRSRAVLPVGVRCHEKLGAADPAAVMVIPATTATAARSDIRFSTRGAYPIPSTSKREKSADCEREGTGCSLE